MKARRSRGGVASTRIGFAVLEGVGEAEDLGVEGLAVELGLAAGAVGVAVALVADDGVADGGEVEADLVGAAGFEPDGEQGGDGSEAFDDAIMGDGVDAEVVAAGDSVALALAADDQGAADGGLLAGDDALDDGEVLALHLVLAEEGLKGVEGLGRLGEGERAGGFLVEPVDDADVRLAAVADGEVVLDSGGEGVGFVRGGGEGQDAGGLVDDDDVGVLEQDVELRADDAAGLGAVGVEVEDGVGSDEAAGFVAAGAVEVDAAGADGFLGGGAGEGEAFGDEFVDADGGVGGCHGRGDLRRFLSMGSRGGRDDHSIPTRGWGVFRFADLAGAWAVSIRSWA